MYRIDIFMNGSHISRLFDTEIQARKASEEAKRDGAKAVFLLKHVFENRYDVMERL